jgi:putative phosphoesterase
MNIAVLADIHGNYRALKAVIADMDDAGADGVIILGDILFCGDEPQACFDAVKALRPIVWLRGNTDDWLNEIDENFSPRGEKEERIFAEYKRVLPLISSEARAAVAALPEKQSIEVCGKTLLCVHGSDRRINESVGRMTTKDELEALTSRIGADIMLCGHTHEPYTASANGKTVINAGSVGKPAGGSPACWCMLSFKGGGFAYEIRRTAY